MPYSITEFTVIVPGAAGESDLLRDRMSHTADAMQYMLSQSMYGDGIVYVPPTRRQRFTRYWRGFPDRARDAWDVLLGRTRIGDD